MTFYEFLILNDLCKFQLFVLTTLTFSTSTRIWISSITRRTFTISTMASGCTNSIWCTITRINTLFISTSLVIWTFWICQTFNDSTNLVWVASISWQTCTFGYMSINRTLGIRSTSLINTWVLTFSVNACLRKRTFVVALTAS